MGESEILRGFIRRKIIIIEKKKKKKKKKTEIEMKL
jgi:hypothetical protein